MKYLSIGVPSAIYRLALALIQKPVKQQEYAIKKAAAGNTVPACGFAFLSSGADVVNARKRSKIVCMAFE